MMDIEIEVEFSQPEQEMDVEFEQSDMAMEADFGELQTVNIGLSAYQVAVKNGFEGTEEEWLESLKGPKGDPGDDYILTEADKAEIAEMAAEMVEVPESGGDVDLTGYATEQYVQDYAQPKGEYLTAVPDGYAKIEDIPTRPEDIGAQPSGNYALKSEIPSVPVQSVNGKTGAVKLSAGDVGARPSNWMPTAQEVGALPDTYVPPNQTAAQVGADPAGTAAAVVSSHNTNTDAHNDIRLELKAINDRLNAFFDSDNQTLDELSEIVAYITNNKTLIDSITTSKVNVADIINNLTTNVSNKPLSSAQGVVLKGLIDTVSNSLSNYQPKGDYALKSEIPDISGKLDSSALPTAINTALAQAKASGEFDGKDGVDGQPGKDGADGVDGKDGYTPVKGTDYFTGADKAEFSEYIASELAKRGQLEPLYANSIEECTDTTKLYVLPDGYIYAYVKKETPGGKQYTNRVPTSVDTDGSVFNGKGYQDGLRLSSSGATKTAEYSTVTGYIRANPNDVIRVAGVEWYSDSGNYLCAYDSSFNCLGNLFGSFKTSSSNGIVVTAECSVFNDADALIKLGDKDTASVVAENIRYIRVSSQGLASSRTAGIKQTGANMIVTVNEEVVETAPSIIQTWVNTGHAFVPADYEDRIVALEEEATETTKSVKALQQQVEDIVAGNTEIAAITKFDPAEYGLPILRVTGNTASMTKDNAVTLDYVYGTLSGSCTMKWQGSSSIKWPKKNYTIKFDNEFEAYEGWGAQKKYCLKANYIDFSHSRNLVCAKLWGQVVKSRKTANTKLNALVNGGAVDGFPICLFVNDVYQGIYTFNIPKDGWMFGMGSGASEAVVCAEGPTDDSSAVKFRKADVRLETDFGVEYVPDENNTTWVKTSLDRMIAACINSNGADLDTTVAQYLDWDSVIDYICFMPLQNGFDCLTKNLILATYDGVKWFLSAYDMDSTYGLHWDGTYFHTTKTPKYNNMASIGEFCNRNRAMELVKLYKKDALKTRYAALRADILSEDNVATTFANFMGGIPKALFDKECTIWKNLPSTATNNLSQITDFYRRKCAVIDAEMNAL